jgi:hypothetical protein
MPRMDLMRFMLCSATVSLALFSISKPAQACSDLPNICQQREQQHQENVERARQEQENYYIQQREQQEQENMERAREEQQSYTQQREIKERELLNQANSITKQMELELATENLEQTRRDPKFQKYLNGGWDFVYGRKNAAPGEYCGALFMKKDGGMVSVMGPGGDYKGATLTFWGKDIPRPNKIEKIRATLSQSIGKPQTVQVFNYIVPNSPYGAISFTVPTIESALTAMKDVESFDIAIDGKSVVKVEWNGGLAARDKLRQCVSARTKKIGLHF